MIATTVLSVSILLPLALVAQTEVSLPVSAGLHNLTLPRADQPAIHGAILIPSNYSPPQRVPLILALHFGLRGEAADGAGSSVVRILVGPALKELGAIIVAPDSQGGDWSSPENEPAVNALLDMVMAKYSVDPGKVAVTGYSMGGAGSWQFAAKYPDRFSAVIPVAGRPPQSVAGWRLPILAIHSRDDDVMPIGLTEARITELQKSGVNAKMIALTGITHFQTSRFVEALREAVPWLKEIWK